MSTKISRRKFVIGAAALATPVTKAFGTPFIWRGGEVKPVVIDGASHFFLDLYGEEAADLIAKFLKADQPATTK